jgi:2-polyprenyl-3-methyl-5-hydroxy-6-metoxy-1,4-benzoquinol methylase
MTSKITGGETELLFTAKLLSKYNVRFFRCKHTGFIQTEEPYWLQESYSSAITKLDVGLVMRNQNLVNLAVPLFLNYFDHDGLFLDYAGGYGLFTRMMRDKGFNFYHTDIYCQNIFAEYNDLKELPAHTKFEVVTAFEVVEHLVSPMEEIKNILAYGDNLFFTTELVQSTVTMPEDWWYLSLETGQHISFYTKEALQYIAKQLGKFFYTDGKWLHLFTKNELPQYPFTAYNAREPFFIRKIRKHLKRHDEKSIVLSQKKSLMGKDIEEAKRRISS